MIVLLGVLIPPCICDVPVRVECTLGGLEESLGVKKQRLEVGPGSGILPLWLTAEARSGLRACYFKFLPLGKEGKEWDEKGIYRELQLDL